MTPDQERDALAQGLHPKAGRVRPVTRDEAAVAVGEKAQMHEGQLLVWCLLGRAPNDVADFPSPVWLADTVVALIKVADRVAIVEPATPDDPPAYLTVVAAGELYQFALTDQPTYVDAT